MTARRPAPANDRLQRDGAHEPPLNRVFMLVPAQAFVGDFLQTFKEFQPRGSTKLCIDGVIKQFENPVSRQ